MIDVVGMLSVVFFVGFLFLIVGSVVEKSPTLLILSLLSLLVCVLGFMTIAYQEETTTKKIVDSKEYKVHRVEGQPIIIVNEKPVKLVGFYEGWKSICIDKYEDIDDDWFVFETVEVYRKPGESVPKPTWYLVRGNNTEDERTYFNWYWNDDEGRWEDRAVYEN